MGRIIQQWPKAVLDARVRGGELADVELPQAIAGRARWLYEMATGAPATDDEPGIPRNPQGLYGHDHSGPPYGSALRHTIFAWGGTRDDVEGTNWTTTRGIIDLHTGGAPDRRTAEVRGRVWVRPHVERGVGPPFGARAPYDEGHIEVRAKSSSGTQTVNVSWSTDDGIATSETFGATTTRSAYGLTAKMRLRSGWNNVWMRFDVTSSSSVYILGCSVSQIVKR
jgi:hypothetical protein